MDVRNAANGRGTSLASGVAVTVLVVMAGVAAGIADLGPAAPAIGVDRAVAHAATAPEADGFRVPDDLRVNAAEVPAHVEAF